MKKPEIERNYEILRIALITDNNYIVPTAVAMKSIINTCLETNDIHFYIVTSDLLSENTAYFTTYRSEFVDVTIIDESATEFDGIHKWSKHTFCVASEAALLKFKLPDLLPELDKVLYLDGDVVVMQPLGEVFATDLEDCYAAVVQDSGILYTGSQYKKSFEHYFNSGFMLLNLKKMREHSATNILIETKRNATDTSLMDQNIFNEVFGSQTIRLPMTYNFLYINLLRAKEQYTMEGLNDLFDTEFPTLEAVLDAAVVVHFSSKDKPWKFRDVPFGDVWYSIFLQSSCRDLEISREYLDQAKSLEIYKTEVSVAPKYQLNEALPEIVVSLTSYPARIDCVSHVVLSILKQTMEADRIVLWLAESQFPNKEQDLPDALIGLTYNGLEIRWCDDLRPHKKYYYAFQEFPDSIVITVDDDVKYQPNLIAQLMASYIKFPFAVSAMRAHIITLNSDGSIAPYDEWKKRYARVGVPSMALCPTGVGGVLYPPRIFPPELWNKEHIRELCLDADDLWLKTFEVIACVPAVVAAKPTKMEYVGTSQDIGLWIENTIGKNDLQLQKILNLYNAIDGGDESVVLRIARSYCGLRRTENQMAPSATNRGNQRTNIVLYTVKKIFGGIKCYQENGWHYTIQRIKVKLKKFFKR